MPEFDEFGDDGSYYDAADALEELDALAVRDLAKLEQTRWQGDDDICTVCDGAGTLHGHLCKTCQGTGQRN